MQNNHHTGITFHDYEITISPRGGIGVESKKIVRARAKFAGESEISFLDHLKEAAINAGLAVAQYNVTRYIKKM